MMLRNAWKWSLNLKNSNQKVVGGWLKLPFEFYIWPITILWAIWVCFIDLSEMTFIRFYFFNKLIFRLLKLELSNPSHDGYIYSGKSIVNAHDSHINNKWNTSSKFQVGKLIYFFWDNQEIHLQPVACCKETCLGKCAAFQDTFENGQQSSLFTIFIAFIQVA